MTVTIQGVLVVVDEADWLLFCWRGGAEWAALGTAGMIQEWTPLDNSQVSGVFWVILSMGTCCFQRKIYFPAIENFCGANAFYAQPKHQALVQSFQLTSTNVAPTLADFLLC